MFSFTILWLTEGKWCWDQNSKPQYIFPPSRQYSEWFCHSNEKIPNTGALLKTGMLKTKHWKDFSENSNQVNREEMIISPGEENSKNSLIRLVKESNGRSIGAAEKRCISTQSRRRGGAQWLMQENYQSLWARGPGNTLSAQMKQMTWKLGWRDIGNIFEVYFYQTLPHSKIFYNLSWASKMAQLVKGMVLRRMTWVWFME